MGSIPRGPGSVLHQTLAARATRKHFAFSFRCVSDPPASTATGLESHPLWNPAAATWIRKTSPETFFCRQKWKMGQGSALGELSLSASPLTAIRRCCFSLRSRGSAGATLARIRGSENDARHFMIRLRCITTTPASQGGRARTAQPGGVNAWRYDREEELDTKGQTAF